MPDSDSLEYPTNASSPARAVIELVGGVPEKPAYYNEDFIDFRNGKIYLNPKPGLGVKFDPSKAELLLEVTENTKYTTPLLKDADGALRNW